MEEVIELYLELAFIVYIVYFILLAIVFGIIGFLLKKVFHKDISKKKMFIWFLIILVFPFAFFKGCKSYLDHGYEEYHQERSQEPFVRKFLAENEASSLVLPKFNVVSYEGGGGEKWVIEFEEPIDSTQLKKLDQSGTAKVKGRVLFFPIVRGYSESIDPDFLKDDDETEVAATKAIDSDNLNDEEDAASEIEVAETSAIAQDDLNDEDNAASETEVAETKEEEESDYKYDYRYFKLELLPDCKTAVLIYAYHQTWTGHYSSGSSWSSHDD